METPAGFLFAVALVMITLHREAILRHLFLTLAFGAAVFAAPAIALPPAGQVAVERGLLPAAVFDGKVEAWTIEARMARWNVPGVSIAVIDDGKVAWARGYGVLAAGEAAPVTTDTRFQAASISKPVAATAALSLVQDGTLTLDGDINAVLTSWKLPASAFSAERPVALGDLLSHTAGVTVHGFPGYAQGAALPTNVQVLSGAAPASTRAVVSWARPGEQWQYSGGGYQIVQQMIEDRTGKTFAEVVQARVLTPSGMTASGYVLPAKGGFAFAHDNDGRPISGGWHTYPESASAGLWTTPTDLARFGLALSAAYNGKPGALLDPAIAMPMMKPVKGGYGLGPGVRGEGDAVTISHGGSNAGFNAFWVIHPRTGDGVAVMTNGDLGDRLMMEIVRGVAKIYGWPDYLPEQHAVAAVDPEILTAREGRWATDVQGQPLVFTLRREGGRMAFDTFRGTLIFTPVSATTLVAADTGATATFETDAAGKPVLRAFGLTLTRAR